MAKKLNKRLSYSLFFVNTVVTKHIKLSAGYTSTRTKLAGVKERSRERRPVKEKNWGLESSRTL